MNFIYYVSTGRGFFLNIVESICNTMYFMIY